MNKRLYRSSTDKMLFGVCGGLGDYFDIDPVIIRLLFVALAFAGGIGILIYIIAGIIVPEDTAKKTTNSSTKIEEKVEKSEKVILKKNFSAGELFFALILIFLGLGLLMQNLFSWFSFDNFFPVVLIVLGGAILINKGKKGN